MLQNMGEGGNRELNLIHVWISKVHKQSYDDEMEQLHFRELQ